MAYDFVIADVFTERAFGGNQLAVLPDAEGLSDEAMQALAREFNFAETTFVLPPGLPGCDFRVRIFTPRRELPFAGHPTVGTAAALVHLGRISAGTQHVVFEEGVGPVGVEVDAKRKPAFTRLVLEAQPEVRDVDPVSAAAALSTPRAKVQEAWSASVGVPFVFARLDGRDAVDAAMIDRNAWSRGFADAWASAMFLYSGSHASGSEIYARMFAPGFGIEEDPATGGAAAAFAAALAERASAPDGDFTWAIDQGVALGRPSRMEAGAKKRDGRIIRIAVGGSTVITGEGRVIAAV